jgi:hypothetical protein
VFIDMTGKELRAWLWSKNFTLFGHFLSLA